LTIFENHIYRSFKLANQAWGIGVLQIRGAGRLPWRHAEDRFPRCDLAGSEPAPA
jgi:hypothetical protein